MIERYEPQTFEAKWQERWKDANLFATQEKPGAPKFYGLDFFPYPSGAGLSVGHCRNYIPTDVLCRMKVMQGFNVLHPMGFDAFGLPAENEAIKNKVHPQPMIERYAANYQRQMDLVGISYDWGRSFSSSDPRYYRWTQWIFELLYKRGLAYQKMAAVNWDPIDKTVLADEEIIGGRAERSGAIVEKRLIPQWFFRITDYAQRLIDDLDLVDWPEGIKQQQRNWIGRSEGVQFKLVISSSDSERWEESAGIEVKHKPKEAAFEVFTTRIDTLFGATFCVLAPDHVDLPSFMKLVSPEDRKNVEEYQALAKTLSDTDRLATDREKTGVFSGLFAINPATGREMPIWIADYVLATYGTGGIMAVPAHDERDFEFATKFGLPIYPVIAPEPNRTESVELPFVSKDGYLINSGEFTSLSVAEAQTRLSEWVESTGIGFRKIQYRLRDWLISRQRYWGCPIPVINSAEDAKELVPEDCLPVLLPDVENYEPTDDGSSPLARIPEFVNVTDLEGKLGKRETDTMGGFACSSWYFLRFCDPHNDEAAFDPAKVNYWMPVDCYVGGAEHAVMHLLYARFWTKVLYDAGLVSVQEPFNRLLNQGQVLANTVYRLPNESEKLAVGEEGIIVSYKDAASIPEDQKFYRWARMSKSKGNVVTPEQAVAEYGADALRVFELFVAPFESDVRWSNEGMQGSVRFLSRFVKFVSQIQPFFTPHWNARIDGFDLNDVQVANRRAIHSLIKKVTEDIDRFAFNTAISSFMECLNTLTDNLKSVDLGNPSEADVVVLSEAAETLTLLIAPIAPHTADELWESLGKEPFTYNANWPRYQERLTEKLSVVIAIQVNGKLRDTIELAVGLPEAEVLAAAKESLKVQAHLDGKTIRKEIVIPNKLVNIVAN